MKNKQIGIRWTIGNVRESGFEALALSITAARRLFGPQARYAVYVNSLPLRAAQDRLGPVANHVQWMHAADHIPSWLRHHLDEGMAEGVAWKLAPVRVFPDCYELSLDNDVILWQIPTAMKQWLASDDPEACLMAEDAQRSLGQFSHCSDLRAINSGIRGLPPGFDLGARLQRKLHESPVALRSELDEQGLQAATLADAKLTLVSKDEVTICSPFPMHQQALGRCGAHFVGLNQRQMPWQLDGRFAHEVIQERWREWKPQINRLIDEMDAPHWRESIPQNGHYFTVKGNL